MRQIPVNEIWYKPGRGGHRHAGRGLLRPEPATLDEPAREGRQGRRRPTLPSQPRSLPARLPGRHRLGERSVGAAVFGTILTTVSARAPLSGGWAITF